MPQEGCGGAKYAVLTAKNNKRLDRKYFFENRWNFFFSDHFSFFLRTATCANNENSWKFGFLCLSAHKNVRTKSDSHAGVQPMPCTQQTYMAGVIGTLEICISCVHGAWHVIKSQLHVLEGRNQWSEMFSPKLQNKTKNIFLKFMEKFFSDRGKVSSETHLKQLEQRDYRNHYLLDIDC